MEANTNSSSPIGRLVPVLIVFFGLIGLYYLYQYLFGPKSSNMYTLLSSTQSANIDPSHPIIVTSDKLPSLYEGGEFTVSCWVYVSNWSYRAGFNKSILNIGGPNFDTIRIYLGGNKPKLSVRLQTKDRHTAVNSVTSNMSQVQVQASQQQSQQQQVPIESLDKTTQNAVFNILQTDSGLLDSSPLCDLPELDLQRWVNIAVSVNGKTVDVYLDGKLARSCVLPSFYKVDTGGYSAYLLSYGGFGGQISTVTMYDSALNPEQVYKNYMAGPEPITNLSQWLSSLFIPSTKISITTN